MPMLAAVLSPLPGFVFSIVRFSTGITESGEEMVTRA